MLLNHNFENKRPHKLQKELVNDSNSKKYSDNKNVFTINLSDTLLNIISPYFRQVQNILRVRQLVRFVRVKFSNRNDLEFARNELISLHNLEIKRFLMTRDNNDNIEKRLPAFANEEIHRILSLFCICFCSHTKLFYIL